MTGHPLCKGGRGRSQRGDFTLQRNQDGFPGEIRPFFTKGGTKLPGWLLTVDLREIGG